MKPVDLSTAGINERGALLDAREPLCLEAPNLTCGRRLLRDYLTTRNPAHGRIARQTVGVHIIQSRFESASMRATFTPVIEGSVKQAIINRDDRVSVWTRPE